MAITLDAERVWKVACDLPDCGWRTYVSAPTEVKAFIRSTEVFGVGAGPDGSVRCAKHREGA